MTNVSRYFFTIIFFALTYDSSVHAMMAERTTVRAKKAQAPAKSVTVNSRPAAVVTHRPPPPVAPAPPVAHYDAVSASAAPAGSDVPMVPVGAYSPVPPTVVPTARAVSVVHATPVVPSAPAGSESVSGSVADFSSQVEGLPHGPMPVAVALPAGVVVDAKSGDIIDRIAQEVAALNLGTRRSHVTVDVGESISTDGKVVEEAKDIDVREHLMLAAEESTHMLIASCKAFYQCVTDRDLLGLLTLLQHGIRYDFFDEAMRKACGNEYSPYSILLGQILYSKQPKRVEVVTSITQILNHFFPKAPDNCTGYKTRKNFINRLKEFAGDHETRPGWAALDRDSQNFIVSFIMLKLMTLLDPSCSTFGLNMAGQAIKLDNHFALCLFMSSGMAQGNASETSARTSISRQLIKDVKSIDMVRLVDALAVSKIDDYRTYKAYIWAASPNTNYEYWPKDVQDAYKKMKADQKASARAGVAARAEGRPAAPADADDKCIVC